MPVFPDLDTLSTAAAEEFRTTALQAVAERGRFTVALAGGSTPKRLYQRLAEMDGLPWDKTILFYGDERLVPPTHELSNERMAKESLIDHVKPSADYGMVRAETREECAEAYEAQMKEVLGEETSLDLVLVGLGPDGHTLSLFPGQPAVYEKERWVISTLGGVGIAERITLTAPFVNRARNVWFMAAGADKIDALRRVFEGPENWDETPSQAVARHAEHCTWFVDQALTAGLSEPSVLG
jgi:6-phosphogluconolactonase